MANKRAVLPGLGIKIVPFMLRLFPRGFILSAVTRFQTRTALITIRGTSTGLVCEGDVAFSQNGLALRN